MNIMALVEYCLRWMHYFFGVIWIGHLYYFNFTQGTFLNDKDVDASAKSALRMKLLPVALWWFRWGAMWTFVTGALYLAHKGHGFGSLADFFASGYGTTISIGALLGITMWANVWFVIWPKQQIVIENVNRLAKGETALPAAADAAARANVASRTNTLLSLPMLFFMGAASHLTPAITENSNLGAFWACVLVLWALIEGNALKGKTYKVMTTVGQTIHSGILTTVILVGLMYALL